MKKKPSFSVVFAFVLISAQVALYIFMWFRLLGDPLLRTMDFISFYGTGRLVRSGQLAHIYNIQAEAAVQRRVVGSSDYTPLLFNHPPQVVPILALIAVDSYVTSYVLWTVVRLFVFFICGVLIYRFFLLSGWGFHSALLGAIECVTFFPAFVSILGGQDTVFSLIGLLIWMFALLREQELAAGLGLAFASLSPTIAGALALPLFASKRRASLWFVLAMFVLTVLSLTWIGIQGGWDFLNLLRLSSVGQVYGMNQPAMYNLLGMLLRNVPSFDPQIVHIIAWIAAGTSILFLCIWWWNKRQRLQLEHLGIAVVLSVFTAPHLHLHALAFLVLPALALMQVLWRAGYKTPSLLFLPSVSALLLLGSFFSSILGFTTAYLFMLVLFAGLIWGLRNNALNRERYNNI